MSLNNALAMNDLTVAGQARRVRTVKAGGPGSGRHGGGGHTSTQFDVRKFKSGADAYKAGHAHVLDQIERIKALLQEHKPTGTEHWGHAGDISHYSEGLADIHNSMAHTGEYEK